MLPFSYSIIYSNRKSLAIQVKRDGSVLVRAPKGYPKRFIEEHLIKQTPWIIEKTELAKQAMRTEEETKSRVPPFTEAEKQDYIRQAKEYFPIAAKYHADRMGVTFGRITIREQKTRWGSCSSKGNLNFNWRLMLAPEWVRDYVVVHELAHRKEMNHSPAFYREVKKELPDYEQAKTWLRKNGATLWIR